MSGREPLIEQILEAAIAIDKGQPGATAAGLIRMILDRKPALSQEVNRLALLASTRPADYWSHA